MAERGNLRRWGRIDALVMAVVCLLLVFFVPVLFARPRERSIRLVCAANLSQIGKTMFVYAADNEDALPKAGGPGTVWGPVTDWVAPGRHLAFGLHNYGGEATISSSFYLLVKYYQMPTRLFLCRGDKGTTEFKLSDLATSFPAGFALADAWDFGPPGESWRHCSFSYHTPYGLYRLTTSRDPNLAVVADRNPFIASPGAEARSIASFKPDLKGYGGIPEQARAGNAITHELDGQNVLFLDGRVTFENRPYCALDAHYGGKDNIYLVSGFPEFATPEGFVPTRGSWPQNAKDSVLVHDPNHFPPLTRATR